MTRGSPLPGAPLKPWASRVEGGATGQAAEETPTPPPRVTFLPPAGGIPSPLLRGSDSDASSVQELPETRAALSLSLPPGALPGRLSLGLETSLTSVQSLDSTLEFHDAPLGEDPEEEEEADDKVLVNIKAPQDGTTEKSITFTDEEEEGEKVVDEEVEEEEEEEEKVVDEEVVVEQEEVVEEEEEVVEQEKEVVEQQEEEEEEQQKGKEEDVQEEVTSQEDDKTLGPQQAEGDAEEELLETNLEEEEEEEDGAGSSAQQDSEIFMEAQEPGHSKEEEVLRPAGDQELVDAVVCDARVEDLDRTEKTFEYSEFTEHLEVTAASQPQHEPTESLEPTTGEGSVTTRKLIGTFLPQNELKRSKYAASLFVVQSFLASTRCHHIRSESFL